jgi:integrase
MASIEPRQHKSGTSYRVVWREDGEKQWETFRSLTAATKFRKLVEGSSNHWPSGWVKGRGAPDDHASSDAPLFRDYAEKTISARQKADEGTKGGYRRLLVNHINPVLGHIPVDRIDRFHISKVADRMTVAGRATKTISNAHGLLSSILSDAVTDRLIDRNPAVGVLPNQPDSKTEEMVFMTPADFGILVSHVSGDTNKALVTLLVGTGLRWSEATALQVHDVDIMGRRAVDVSRAWKRRGGGFILGSPKTNRSRRTVSLPPELVDLLIPLVASRDPGEFLFTLASGRPIRHNNFYNRVWVPAVKAARDAGLMKSPRIHDLRHTHASWLIDAKVTLPAIQRRLGHESITTTIDRYGHLAPEHVDEINAAIDRALVLPGAAKVPVHDSHAGSE